MTLPPKTRVRRFTALQRCFHTLLMVTFLVQGATGLARMYMETAWGRSLGALFGGYEASRTVHVYVGIFMVAGFAIHTLYLLAVIDWKRFPKVLWGPDSLMPRFTDLKQFFQHITWCLGARRHPDFDRWGYWEKFDYWAVFWGMTIIGITGIILAYPLIATKVIPGWGLNLAFWVHRIEALLAMGHIFIIHFFIGHLRRHNFPMDRSIFEGSVPLETLVTEKPSWIARLKQNGTIHSVLVAEAGVAARIAFYAIGYAAIFCGLFLLIGALVNLRSVSWY